MERTILHVDANCFYASVECAQNPDIADKPVAVVGDASKRHGIVLTANYIAKRRYGIRTGDVIWQAQRKCPELIKITARMDLYMRYSQRLRELLLSYSDYVEPFGCDEAWVELRGMFKNSGREIADKIRARAKKELGITVSVGVSFNKVFAKLASDMKKPDATTEIRRDNFKEMIWKLPAEDLLYVGAKTKAQLNKHAIYTIGDIANTDVILLNAWLGKQGQMIHCFANGYDMSPVAEYEDRRIEKSIGNSTTCARDLVNNTEVKAVLMLLADHVASRLRERGVKGREITIGVRDSHLRWVSHRCTLSRATYISNEIGECAMRLFCELYGWSEPVRSLGVTVSGLCSGGEPEQIDLFGEEEKRLRLEALDRAGDCINKRFGRGALRRARFLIDIDRLAPGFMPETPAFSKQIF